VAALAAQASGRQEQLAPPADLGRACGVSAQDGELWGLGPDYKVRFLSDGFAFTPALGPKAPRNLPLRFAVDCIGRQRAGEPLRATPIAAAEIERDDHTVRYRRGPVTETYELRPEGMEQSFTFASLPPGGGDLVVRGTIATELSLAEGRAGDALDFSFPGLGGVRIGAVTGLDARGARTPGTVAWVDGAVELRLPAAFVDRAVLPLVLDPLIGTTLGVASGGDDSEPDVAAYDGPSAGTEYLVVWTRTFSSGDVDIRAQRVADDGTLEGGLIGVRTSAALRSDQPRAASVALRGRYVVVWREASGANPAYVAACSIDAATGSVSAAIQVVAGADAFQLPDVGGDAFDLGDQAIAVWENASQHRIEACRLTVATSGALSASGRSILSGSDLHAAPSIAQDGGEPGRYLVAWETTTRTAFAVSGAVVDRTLAVRDRPTLVPGSTIRRTAVDVGGDGTHWTVAYERRVDSRTLPDVYCLWVNFDPRTDAAYFGAEVAVDTGSGSESGPAVVWLNRSVLVADLQFNASLAVHGGYLRSLDQFSFGSCEGFFVLESTTTRDVRNVAGSGDRNAGLLVWESIDPGTGIGTVRARRFRQETGSSVTFVNSPCGSNARVHATCVRPGNLGFRLRLEHAEPARPAFVILQPRHALIGVRLLACGSCEALLDPFRSLVLPVGMTDAHGNASLGVPIPAALGSAYLTYQFGFVPSNAPGCPVFGLSFAPIVGIGT